MTKRDYFRCTVIGYGRVKISYSGEYAGRILLRLSCNKLTDLFYTVKKKKKCAVSTVPVVPVPVPTQ